MTPAVPARFWWGSSTASYQVEGAVDEDGRGPSIWDTFAHTPGRVANGDTGDVACDHYHRYVEDIEIMRSLGLTASRFSIAWSRIQPSGRGAPEQRGLDHYRRVLEALLSAGIEPFPTLYHWDLPQALEDAGGWPSRETAYRFAEYAAIVDDALGDLVGHWTTMNEPYVASRAGYGSGDHAPGISDPGKAHAAAHHLLLGHGLAVQALRSGRHGGQQIGIVLNQTFVDAASESAADIAAAVRVDGDNNRMFLDPLLRGSYPADMTSWFGWPDGGGGGEGAGGDVRDGDLRLIAAPLDFVGVNYYRRSLVRAWPTPAVSGDVRLSLDAEILLPDGVPTTSVGWPVQPDGLTALLLRLNAEYPDAPPWLVTENGCSSDDVGEPGVEIEDSDRISYLETHIDAVRAAVEAGVDVRGYFVWSLLDNFEWAEGYRARFGIVSVDYPTQRRTPKASARRLRELVAAGSWAAAPGIATLHPCP